jgi:hypothetical protein
MCMQVVRMIAIVAALLLLSGSVWAGELPRYMLGYWCFNKHATWALDGFAEDGTDNRSIYSRAKNFDECANRGGMRLSQSRYVVGRFEAREYCKIEKIKRVRAGAYLIQTTCEDFELSRPSFRAVSEGTEQPEETLLRVEQN